MQADQLKDTATEIRKDIVKMIYEAGSGHPGGSLSCTDILCALYFGGVLNYSKDESNEPGKDHFIMAKGHAAPALYATLSKAGFFPHDELFTLRSLGSRLQGHPDSTLCPGVEVSTGSLGQGLSIACGLASGLKLKNDPGRVFALLGDGECEEGQVWEAAMFASHNGLGNLIAIVDANGLQIDGKIEDVSGLTDLSSKFASFGFDVIEVNGHNIEAMVDVLTAIKNDDSPVPHVVIAKTTKGKGVSFMEGNAGWHGKAPNKEEFEQALSELDQL